MGSIVESRGEDPRLFTTLRYPILPRKILRLLLQPSSLCKKREMERSLPSIAFRNASKPSRASSQHSPPRTTLFPKYQRCSRVTKVRLENSRSGPTTWSASYWNWTKALKRRRRICSLRARLTGSGSNLRWRYLLGARDQWSWFLHMVRK